MYNILLKQKILTQTLSRIKINKCFANNVNRMLKKKKKRSNTCSYYNDDPIRFRIIRLISIDQSPSLTKGSGN